MKDLREEFELYKKLKRGEAELPDPGGEPVVRYDVVVIPESDSGFVRSAAQRFVKPGGSVLVLEKRSPRELMGLLHMQNMQRAEKQKLFGILQQLDHLEMHAIPGNERKRFIDILFRPVYIDEGKTVLLFDDASFSGTTMKAMQAAVTRYDDCLALFGYSMGAQEGMDNV